MRIVVHEYKSVSYRVTNPNKICYQGYLFTLNVNFTLCALETED